MYHQDPIPSEKARFEYLHSFYSKINRGISRPSLLVHKLLNFLSIAAVRNDIDAAHREVFLPLLLNSIAEFKQRCGLGIDLPLILIFYYVLGAVARDKCE